MSFTKIILKIFFFLLIINFACLIFGDTIYLKDGSIIKGEIISEDESVIIIKTSMGELNINRTDIESIEYEKEKVAVQLKDGSKLKGEILKENEKSIFLKTNLGELTINRDQIEKIETTEGEVKPEEKQEKPLTSKPIKKEAQKPKAAEVLTKERENIVSANLNVGGYKMGICPSIRFWATDNIGLEGMFSFFKVDPLPGLGLNYSFTTIEPRFLYRFPKAFSLKESSLRSIIPYIGCGIAFTRTSIPAYILEAAEYADIEIDQTGQGFDFFVGADFIFKKVPKLELRGEFGYDSTSFAGFAAVGGFSIRFGIGYYFK